MSANEKEEERYRLLILVVAVAVIIATNKNNATRPTHKQKPWSIIMNVCLFVEGDVIGRCGRCGCCGEGGGKKRRAVSYRRLGRGGQNRRPARSGPLYIQKNKHWNKNDSQTGKKQKSQAKKKNANNNNQPTLSIEFMMMTKGVCFFFLHETKNHHHHHGYIYRKIGSLVLFFFFKCFGRRTLQPRLVSPSFFIELPPVASYCRHGLLVVVRKYNQRAISRRRHDHAGIG